MAKIIKNTEKILIKLKFSFKNKYPKMILIIGVIKYPIDASWTLSWPTANMKPPQFDAIKVAVIVSINNFFFDLNIWTNSLKFEKK